MRGMSLFTLTTMDPDAELNRLTTTLTQSYLTPQSDNPQTNCTNLLTPPTTDWFSLVPLDNSTTSVIQLTDIGYDSLIHTATRTNHLQITNCQFNLHLTTKVSDTLFTNQKQLTIRIHFNPNFVTQQQRSVPVLATITTVEGVKPTDEYLLNLQKAVVIYLTSSGRSNQASSSSSSNTSADTAYLVGRELGKYRLLNYIDQFYVNANSLMIRSPTKFDREQHESFELFFGHNTTSNRYIPDVFRVLVKLVDVNDNEAKFFEPLEAALSTLSGNDVTGVNRTVSWQELISSSMKVPVLSVQAKDLDVDAAGRVEYKLEGPDIVRLILELDKVTGVVFLNRSLANNATLLDTIWKTYAPLKVAEFEFIIVASDLGVPSLQSTLQVKLNVVFEKDQSDVLLFKQTFYHYLISESVREGHVFGHVKPAVKKTAGNEVVLRIVDGDFYNQFRIDYKTGDLSVQAGLDFTNISSYLLTVSAHDTFRPDQVVNASVRIDLEVSLQFFLSILI